jgi:hypothetical protein
MRATIIGKARNLSIACENADKRVLGDIYVQGYEFIREAFGDENPGQFPSRVEGFISVFAQGSEALRRLLVVRNLEERYQQVIDRFTDLRNLTTFDKDGAKLFISVMLNAADFNYFIGFIEMNFSRNCNTLWTFRSTTFPWMPRHKPISLQDTGMSCRQDLSFKRASRAFFRMPASPSALSIRNCMRITRWRRVAGLVMQT